MSQDIRVLFGRKPDSSKSPESGVNPKKKKRFCVESDSDDDFQSPKSKKNKTSKGKANGTTPKSNKKASPKKKDTIEINQKTLDCMFGRSPVKRSGEKKEENKAVKRIQDEFEDDDEFAAAAMQIGEESDEEWIKEKSFSSSGYSSQGTSVLSQATSSVSPPKNAAKPSDSSSDSQKKIPVKAEQVSIKTSSPIKTKPQKKENNLKESTTKSESADTKKSDLIETRTVKKEEKKDVKFSPVKREAPQVSGLWVDKYKPTNIKQIIGQQGEKSNVNKLIRWLRDWHLNQSGTKKLTKPSPWAKDDSGAYFKAALLSGPPGVGKTTTAHLVCKELEMDMVEFNASDTRSKKLLNQEVGELLSSKSLSPFFTGEGEKVTNRHVLVMDEVDGMAGNEDRGGVQELILLIKNSKVPIICMCNDRNHPKIRSLANYCFDLRFFKPRADQIKGAMLSVCFKEKLKIKPDILTDIIVNTNQDIRLILNHLSMLAASSNNQMKASTKDIKIGPWDVLKKVFSEKDHETMSIHDKSDLFFNDYSIAPLFVQENYLMVVPHSEASKSKLGKMELFAKAAESIANGDLIDRAIRSSNAWSLLPTQAMFSSLVPGDLLAGHMGGQINFPLWLGKNSKKNKMDRLTQEIQSHTRLKMSGSKEDIGLDYCKTLLDAIVRPLSKEGSDGTESALDVMREYSLLREDLDSLSQLSDWNFRPDPFSKLESKVKAAFTRAYNKCPIMSPFAQVSAVKKKSKINDDQNWGSDEDEGEASDQPEDDDNITNDVMIMVKKKTAKEEKKQPKKATQPAAGASSRGGRGGKRGRK